MKKELSWRFNIQASGAIHNTAPVTAEGSQYESTLEGVEASQSKNVPYTS